VRIPGGPLLPGLAGRPGSGLRGAGHSQEALVRRCWRRKRAVHRRTAERDV